MELQNTPATEEAHAASTIDPALAVVAAPEAKPDPTPPAPAGKTFVSYVYAKAGSKKEYHGRVFLAGVIDLFTQVSVEEAERVIAQYLQSTGEVIDRVCVLHWQRLIA